MQKNIAVFGSVLIAVVCLSGCGLTTVNEANSGQISEDEKISFPVSEDGTNSGQISEDEKNSDCVSEDDAVSDRAQEDENSSESRGAEFDILNSEEITRAIPSLLLKEQESITVGNLSQKHEFYNEVIEIDPDCADYIQEISIYDQEIDDTFVVHLSLPPDCNSNEHYPMVVMTDGIWRLSDHPELHAMMKNGDFSKVILVSIGYPNGYDYTTIRDRDLLQEPDKFLTFLVENLIPFLEANYPVSEENMTLTGHSNGGFFAYYALFHSDLVEGYDAKETNLFSNYLIGSPAVQERYGKPSMYDYESEYYDRCLASVQSSDIAVKKEGIITPLLKANVYVTVGGYEESYFINIIDKFGQQVQSREYEGLQFSYEVISKETHNTVFKPSIRNAMIMFYGEE